LSAFSAKATFGQPTASGFVPPGESVFAFRVVMLALLLFAAALRRSELAELTTRKLGTETAICANEAVEVVPLRSKAREPSTFPLSP
jgi:hypothetical protein